MGLASPRVLPLDTLGAQRDTKKRVGCALRVGPVTAAPSGHPSHSLGSGTSGVMVPARQREGTMTTGQLASPQVGQRVWVADGAAGGRRISGVIAFINADFLSS